jgi:dTDP-glucose 4,6-dehydratase
VSDCTDGLAGRTLLVTGGAGFIGTNFVLGAVSRGARVVNLDKLTYAGNRRSLSSLDANERHVFVQGDICDGPLVERLLAEHGVAGVVHFAAESHVDRSIDSPDDFVRTNVMGTLTLLESARRHLANLAPAKRDAFRFLQVSTDEVFGSLGSTGRFTPSTPYAPNSPYAASKAASDHFVRAYHATYGVPTLTTNCSNNYGPYQFPEKLIPLVILNALEGKRLPIYGDGRNVRDWLFVTDHCAAIERVLQAGAPGETYTIGGNNERSNLELVRTICAILDDVAPRSRPYADLIEFVADRPGHDRRYAIDATKIEQELGWRAAHGVDEGLRKTVEWYLANDEWCSLVSSDGYERERLGLGCKEARRASLEQA